MSPTLEVGYKFNVSPYPLDMYGESDTFGSFTLNKTSIDEFKAAFGNPSQELETTYLNLTNSARHLQYNWGYAVFILENSAWQLVRSGHEQRNRHAAARGGLWQHGKRDRLRLQGLWTGGGPQRYARPVLRISQRGAGAGQRRRHPHRALQLQISTSKVWVLEYDLDSNGRVKHMANYYQP